MFQCILLAPLFAHFVLDQLELVSQYEHQLPSEIVLLLLFVDQRLSNLVIS